MSHVSYVVHAALACSGTRARSGPARAPRVTRAVAATAHVVPVAPPPLLAPAPAIHCGLCGSPHVLIVGLAWNMDHHTGDAHYGYEVLCEECHKFSASAHIEQATECDSLWAQARATQARRRAARQTLLARITARLTLRDVH